jgi:hypothetical protein
MAAPIPTVNTIYADPEQNLFCVGHDSVDE